jgi:hypothetical protein
MTSQVTEIPVEPTEEKPQEEVRNKRQIRSPAQLEVLAKARAKAMEARKANQEVTRKARELKQYEREQKRLEVERLYDEMLAKKNKKKEPEPEPEPEPAPLVHEPEPPVPPQRPPSPEPAPAPAHETKPIRSYQVKRAPSQPVAIPQPRAPPVYKSAFENYLGYY